MRGRHIVSGKADTGFSARVQTGGGGRVEINDRRIECLTGNPHSRAAPLKFRITPLYDFGEVGGFVSVALLHLLTAYVFTNALHAQELTNAADVLCVPTWPFLAPL